MKTFMFLPVLLVVIIWLVGAVFGQSQNPTPTPTLWDIVQQIGATLLASDAVWAVLVAWLLTLIPGPFKNIAEGLLAWLREYVRSELEKRRKSAANIAVLSAAQIVKPVSGQGNDRAKKVALDIAKKLGVPDETANERIEAAFKELKGEGLVQ